MRLVILRFLLPLVLVPGRGVAQNETLAPNGKATGCELVYAVVNPSDYDALSQSIMAQGLYGSIQYKSPGSFLNAMREAGRPLSEDDFKAFHANVVAYFAQKSADYREAMQAWRRRKENDHEPHMISIRQAIVDVARDKLGVEMGYKVQKVEHEQYEIRDQFGQTKEKGTYSGTKADINDWVVVPDGGFETGAYARQPFLSVRPDQPSNARSDQR